MHKFNIKDIGKLDNPERRKLMPAKETLIKFGIKDDGTFLDAGCGIGYFTIPAAKIMAESKVIGTDIIAEITDIARDRAKGIKNIEFKVSNEYRLPIDDKSVKYILLSNVIHEIEDRKRYFSEIRRVLKDDGYLLIIEWDKREMKMGPPVTERISREDIINFCNMEGFILSEAVYVSSSHYGLKMEKVIT